MDPLALPYWAVMLWLSVAGVAVACGAHYLVRRFVPYEDLVKHNDVAGFLIAIVSVIFAVLMAFVVIVVWQQYNDADANYGAEVSTASDIHDFARLLPSGERRAIQSLVHQYVREMIADEWPAMRSGGASPQATQTLAQLTHLAVGLVPPGASQMAARAQLLLATQRLFDERNRRLSDNSESLPPVLWMSLIVAAAVTLGFGYLFGVANFRVQLIMSGSIAALIAVMFTLLVELDFPFRRDTAIPVDRWLELERYLDIKGDAAARPDRTLAAVRLQTQPWRMSRVPPAS